MNAKQLALNGLVIRPTGSSNQPAVIVAEGGAKAIKFFKNLLQNRIRWSEESTGNRCNVIWEGIINNSTAGKWRTYEAADEVEAIRVLTEKKLEHFWDYVSNE